MDFSGHRISIVLQYNVRALESINLLDRFSYERAKKKSSHLTFSDPKRDSSPLDIFSLYYIRGDEPYTQDSLNLNQPDTELVQKCDTFPLSEKTKASKLKSRISFEF